MQSARHPQSHHITGWHILMLFLAIPFSKLCTHLSHIIMIHAYSSAAHAHNIFCLVAAIFQGSYSISADSLSGVHEHL